MLVLDVSGGDLSTDARTSLTEALALLLVRRLAVETYSTTSLSERVGLAAEQQLAGCDASACLSELADALGARFVVFSRVIDLGGGRVLRVEVFDKDAGHTVALASVQGRDAAALGRRLPEVVDDLVTAAAGALPVRARPLDVEVPTARSTSPLVGQGLITAGSGLAALAGGATILYLTDEHLGQINAAADRYLQEPSAENAKGVVDSRQDIPEAPLLLCGCAGGVGAVAGAIAALVGAGMAAYGAFNPAEEPVEP